MQEDTGTPQAPETVVAPQVKNENGGVTTPQGPTAAELELQRKLDQATMRANQLEREKQERETQDSEARQKQLEEQNQFRELWEQSEAERKRLLEEREQSARKEEIGQATKTVLSEYPAEVADIAQTVGLELSDTSEAAQTSFKARLDAIAAKINVSPRVPGNNPAPTAAPDASEVNEKAVKQMRYDIPEVRNAARHETIGKLSVLDEMRRQAGLGLTK